MRSRPSTRRSRKRRSTKRKYRAGAGAAGGGGNDNNHFFKHVRTPLDKDKNGTFTKRMDAVIKQISSDLSSSHFINNAIAPQLDTMDIVWNLATEEIQVELAEYLNTNVFYRCTTENHFSNVKSDTMQILQEIYNDVIKEFVRNAALYNDVIKELAQNASQHAR